MHLSIVGIRGIPNSYGGFETLAEYLVEYLAAELTITVYCSSKDMDSSLKEFKGAKLKYIPLTSHGAMGIVYDSLCLLNAVRNSDVVLFLGFGGGFIMPLLSKKSKSKIVLNFGGLDWQRSKWSPFNQKIIKKAEQFLVNNSEKIIADNVLIQQYITNTYDKQSIFIPYGGDQARQIAITPQAVKDYPFLQNAYAFAVTRIQHDNNIDLILESFISQDNIPLVIVGNWDNSEYGSLTRQKYWGNKQLILLDAIYDRDKLDLLRSNCTIYIHGHSAGGTNPSLAEAMYLGLPVFAYASGYNEYTTSNKAIYFSNKSQLVEILNGYKGFDLKNIGLNLQEVAKRTYIWHTIANRYKDVFIDAYSYTSKNKR